MKRGYADTPEGQIYYMTEGEGEPLLLLHQAGSSRQFLKLMPLLAKDYHVIAPDILGLGNSDPLPPKHQMEDLARSFVHFMDALGIDKSHIFGYHTGNKIATEIAAQWPSRVDGLILGGQTHSLMTDHEELNAVLLAHPGITSLSEARQQASRDKANTGPVIRGSEPSPDESPLVQWAVDFSRIVNIWWDNIRQQELSPEVFSIRKDRVMDLLQGGANAEIHKGIFAYDLGARMRLIKAKTLILEVEVPAEEHLGRQGKTLLNLIPNSQLATLQHTSGGFPYDVKTEEFAKIMLEFLHGVRQ